MASEASLQSKPHLTFSGESKSKKKRRHDGSKLEKKSQRFSGAGAAAE